MDSDGPRPGAGPYQYEAYQFVEPDRNCWIPISRDYEVSAELLAETGWSGAEFHPRKGDPAQTADILAKAKSWYNGEAPALKGD